MQSTEIIGNLTQDAQIKDWNGQQFIAFNVADNDSYTDKEGVKHERTNYVSCLKSVFNGNTKVAQYLKKGTLVFVRGRVSSRVFQRQDGKWDSSLNLRVDDLQLLSGSKATQNSTTDTQKPPANQVAANPSEARSTIQMPDSSDDPNGDLPF